MPSFTKTDEREVTVTVSGEAVPRKDVKIRKIWAPPKVKAGETFQIVVDVECVNVLLPEVYGEVVDAETGRILSKLVYIPEFLGKYRLAGGYYRSLPPWRDRLIAYVRARSKPGPWRLKVRVGYLPYAVYRPPRVPVVPRPLTPPSGIIYTKPKTVVVRV